MKLINFKLVTIICELVLSSSVLTISQDLGATGFTVTEVSGQGNGENTYSADISILRSEKF